MAGVAFAGEGDGVGFATESYAASALYTTLASLSGARWRIKAASVFGPHVIGRTRLVAIVGHVEKEQRHLLSLLMGAMITNAARVVCPETNTLARPVTRL
jgi:hypothetical protein